VPPYVPYDTEIQYHFDYRKREVSLEYYKHRATKHGTVDMRTLSIDTKKCYLLNVIVTGSVNPYETCLISLSISLKLWFPTCGTRTLRGTRRTGCGYEKIILVMAENTQKKKKLK
jgi:hypothetical protein